MDDSAFNTNLCYDFDHDGSWIIRSRYRINGYPRIFYVYYRRGKLITMNEEIKYADYNPDSWVLIDIKNLTTGDRVTKILGGWSGGYLDGSYWRLNSGISKVEDEGDTWYITGYSGSTYRVRKTAIRLNSIMHNTYSTLLSLPTKDGQNHFEVNGYCDLEDDEAKIREIFAEYK